MRSLSDVLALASALAARKPRPILAVFAFLALAALGLTVARLGISTDTDAMFPASLPWRAEQLALAAAFPQQTDLSVFVVDATGPDTPPEILDATANALAQKLAADPHFRDVRRPDADPYFSRAALMYLSPEKLQPALDRIIDAQPFLGQLAADPSARGLFAALGLLGLGVTKGGSDLASYAAPLAAFDTALRAAAQDRARPLSWQTLLGGDLAALAGKFRFVLANPVLDHGALLPGGDAAASARAVIAQLPFVRDGSARVRLTGSVALADEEFSTIAQGAVRGLVASLVIIAALLFAALRTWRLVVPVLLTLLLGLCLTLGFAAAAVGTLNLVSVGFGILFVGLAVDFAIQYAVRFRDAANRTDGGMIALAETGRRAGAQILVAAFATAAGFLAFVPTDFAGVAELGLIAGAGMILAFACTVLALPALIKLFGAGGGGAEAGFAAAALDAKLARKRWLVLGVFAILALGGLGAAAMLRFDPDPLHTKRQDSEAVQTLHDLAENPLTNPYTIDILAPDPAAGADLARRLRARPEVSDVLTLDSFVPAHQEQTLPAIEDAAGVLGPTLAVRPPAVPPTPEELRFAARTALDQISPALPRLPAAHPLRAVADDLRRLTTASDATIRSADGALTEFLPTQLASLRAALSAGPVTRADVPPRIARDWILPDGRVRVQVLPTAAAGTPVGLEAFVASVEGVAPGAGGSAAQVVATTQTILGAFRTAAAGALAAITALLFAVLRRPKLVVLVLTPLLLSAALTVLGLVATGVDLNYANIIALPLLLGVGVSFNVYFVMNAAAGQTRPLSSATCRAVLFSAATTATAFGSLGLSAHPGTASMGTVLLLSLASTLLVTLVFLPALLASAISAPARPGSRPTLPSSPPPVAGFPK